MPWIEELKNEGITGGCGDGTIYCPNDPVTRDQMAVFLVAAAGIAPAPCTGIFADVPCPGGYTNFIEQIYNMGITGGCSPPPLNYCPTDLTLRNQMAVFLTLMFKLPLYGP